ncbi:hypothetical protein OQJ46_01865 [Microbulbifer thermotolerans]|uniref:hypothetical protein n=1 Tax=Microbulbifer thermotolerans TaxID=252514 RepID=UPI002248E021|nr:hypothetical protein [Microbulbifer thermotolerans]MCX2779162.1 hypothetical protein [Microbulbifer thermotolerans]MCX2781734.1 hypothetical protein [Microbulbifer thermotolerans]MCX2803586.1 hypothetical protein [Microbulbifer thermotolerans]MCX2830349.1 hypothetical protein [Microbulbifer thermotolerans]MCX2835431.1 hypothetical protein [Microbulbifer thermotolerans]
MLMPLSVAVVIWLVVDSDKRTLRTVLAVNSLPSETRILDHATFSWTDYREEFLISFSGNYEDLLVGREFMICDPQESSKKAAAGLKAHEEMKLKYCYGAGNWQSELGAVTVLLNEERSKAVVVFDQD